MFTMCNAAVNTCWDTATVRRHWTEQWRHDQVRRCPLPNRTEFINFSERNLISNDSSFCLLILSEINLWCFPFEKLLLKSVFAYKRHFWWRQILRHLHITMLQYWAKFSNGLVRWGVKMIRAKNYKYNLSTLCLEYCGLFFFPGHGV